MTMTPPKTIALFLSSIYHQVRSKLLILISSSSSRPPPLLRLDTDEEGGARSKTTPKTLTLPPTMTSDSFTSNDTDENYDDGTTTIVIRRYVDETDRDQVHNLFRRGMESLLPTLTYKVISSSSFYVPVGCISLLVRWCVSKFIISDHDKKFIRSMRGSSLSFLLPELTSLGVILSSVLLVHYTSFVLFNPYIQHSIDADLSNINDVYFNNGGTFLVAVDTSSSTSPNRIVGCVAGEKKTTKKQQEDDQQQQQQQGKDDDGSNIIYELRRMSVDGTIQRRGLGKKLIQALENELFNVVGKTHPKIYLTCSNLQHSAHHLYRKSGFLHVDTTFSKNPNAPLLFRNVVKFYRLEKEYNNENKR